MIKPIISSPIVKKTALGIALLAAPLVVTTKCSSSSKELKNKNIDVQNSIPVDTFDIKEKSILKDTIVRNEALDNVVQKDTITNNELQDKTLEFLAALSKAKYSEAYIDSIKPEVEKNRKTNTGAVGLITFEPRFYNDYKNPLTGVLNTKKEVEYITERIANNQNISPVLREKLIKVVSDGRIAFSFGGTDAEILSLNDSDVNLILEYVNKIPKKPTREDLEKLDLDYRIEYLNNHSDKILISDISESNSVLEVFRNNEIIDERLVNNRKSTVNYSARKFTEPKAWEYKYRKSQAKQRELNNFLGFQTVKDLGVNPYLSNNEILSDVHRTLAESASKVAKDLSTTNQCFTGLKHSLWTSGVIDDYGEIRIDDEIIPSPRKSLDYFLQRPEKFTEIKYIKVDDEMVRKINSTDIYNLPAGCIVLWIPDNNAAFSQEHGHACITNGNGQAYADHTDSQRWEYFRKGEHGSFRVFRLNEQNWEYNSETKKVQYIGPTTEIIKQDNRFLFVNTNKSMEKFANSLKKNKNSLIKDLNIDEKTYDEYVKLALALTSLETEMSMSAKYFVKEAIANQPLVANLISAVKGSPLSSGMTQIKILYSEDYEKELYKKYDIDVKNRNNLEEPEKAAIATVIKLHTFMQDYDKYLNNAEVGIVREASLDDVEKIDKFLSLFSEENWEKLLEIKDILKGDKVAKTQEMLELIEAAKVFVDTQVEKMDKDEWIFARWNGKQRTNSKENIDKSNKYYNTMIQLFIDRQRIKKMNNENTNLYIKQDEPAGYIGKGVYLINNI